MNWASELGFVQERAAHPAVERLDKSVLHWLAGRDLVPFDVTRGAAVEVSSVPVSLTIIPGFHPRLSAPFDQGGQVPGHPPPGNRWVWNGRKVFAGHVIDHVQDAEPSSAAELVMPEIQ